MGLLQPFGHACQLFDGVETRAEAVASFLAEGFRAGDYVVAVARPAHWTAVAARLEARGLSVADLTSQGRFAVYDAAATLARFCPRGRINPFTFNELVGATVEPAAGRRVRAWGEMVDLLAERGDYDGALELEELWNRVGELVPLTLMCSYTSAHFAEPASHGAVRNLCALHTTVHRNPTDRLADWILTMAHHSGRSSLTH